MLTILQYLNERFPIPPVILFALGYAVLAIGLTSATNIWRYNSQSSLANLLLLSCVFFFFLLRQRAIDEFRDAKHDLKYFPDRPVPRGLISRKQVLVLGLCALILEVISAYLVGQKALGFYLLFFFYSLLTAKEFFVPKWLDKHFTIYFLLHEVIFLLLGLFFVFALSLHIFNVNSNLLISLVVLTASPMSIEVIRKFRPRYDKSNKAVADTYSTVWGRRNALLVLISLSFVVGIGLFMLKHSNFFLLFSFINAIAWQLLGKKSDMAVMIIGIVNFLGFALLANIL